MYLTQQIYIGLLLGLFDKSLLHASLNQVESGGLALKNATSKSRTPVSSYQFEPMRIAYEK